MIASGRARARDVVAQLIRLVGFGVVAACFGWASPAAGEDAGSESGEAETKTMSVRFEELGVVRKGGRLTVVHAMERGDWRRLERSELQAWIRLHIPTGPRRGELAYTYTLAVDERSGRLEFPRWLSTFGAKTVGVCPLATGRRDNLGYGSGWICERPTWVRVRSSWSGVPAAAVTTRLYYRSIPMYAPFELWSEPEIPDYPAPPVE